MAVDLQVPDLSDGTDCESEGAFTPTNSPFNLMFPDRPDNGHVRSERTPTHSTASINARQLPLITPPTLITLNANRIPHPA